MSSTSISRVPVVPSKGRVVVVGAGRASSSFVKRLDPVVRRSVVVVAPEKTTDVDPEQFVKATAVDVRRDAVVLETPESGERFDLEYDSLVACVGTKILSVRGAEGKAFALPRDSGDLVRHLWHCKYFHELTGDERYRTVAVVVPDWKDDHLAKEMSGVEWFLDHEIGENFFRVTRGFSGNVNVRTPFSFEVYEGGRRTVQRVGTIVVSAPRRIKTDFAEILTKRAELVDARYGTDEGVLVDGFCRVVGHGGRVFSIGSASFGRSGNETTEQQAERLADLFNRGIVPT